MQGAVLNQAQKDPAPPQLTNRNRVGATRPELSPETVRLYARAWARFAQFCAENGDAALPARPGVVAAFVRQPVRGRGGLARSLAAIDHTHRQHGLAPPDRDPDLRAALRSARKAAPRSQRDPVPAPAQWHRLAQSCPGDLAGRRDRALLLLAAAGLGRTTLVRLQAEQLRFTERGVTSMVAGGAPPVEVARSAAVASCPVRALEDWLRVSATRYGPVFRKVNRWGQLEHAALGTDAVRLIVARRTATLR